jgi:hypothetical protein
MDDIDYSPDLDIPKSDDKTMLIVIIICVCILCVCVSVSLGGYYMTSSSTSSKSNPLDNMLSKITGTPSSKVSASVKTSSKNTSSKPLPVIPGVPKFEEDKSLKAMALECSVNIKDGSPIYTCTHPDNFKIIKLTSGPIFKISSSEETDAFNVKTNDYYIIVPFVFIVDFIVSVNLGDYDFKSVQDFIKEINKVDAKYDQTNAIPDKCLKLPMKTRGESKAPYNTTCIFFPGFTSIGALITTIQKALVDKIPINVLTDYYNMIDTKIQGKNPEITIFEYVMYVASMNKVKSTKYRYYGTCISTDETITC